jgi:cytochrome c oxidase subunit 2
MGQTQNASEHGGLVDHMLGFVHWFMVVLGVGWSIYLAIAFYRFRQKKTARADYHGFRGHARPTSKSASSSSRPFCCSVSPSRSGPVRPMNTRPQPDTIRMRALGEKFLWNFQYPGAT